jgi:hypothetical protein
MSKRQRNSLTVSAAHPPTLPGDAPPALKQKKAARKAEGSGDPVGITFSLLDKAAIVSLSRDRRTASCSKGYRMVRTTTGATSGSWYFEFAVSADTKQGAHYRCVPTLPTSAPPILMLRAWGGTAHLMHPTPAPLLLLLPRPACLFPPDWECPRTRVSPTAP